MQIADFPSMIGFLDQPLYNGNQAVGVYGVVDETIAFKFNKSLDPNNPAVKSFLIRETLDRTKLAYPNFAYELIYENALISGIVCNLRFDRFHQLKFVQRIAWAAAKGT